jgi:hypothetical protein
MQSRKERINAKAQGRKEKFLKCLPVDFCGKRLNGLAFLGHRSREIIL